MRGVILSLLALLLVPGPAAARTVAAIYFQAPAGAPEKVYINDTSGSVALALPRMNLADPVKLAAGDLACRITLTPVTKDQPLPRAAPAVAIPAAWTEVILLFAHNPQDPAFPFTVTAMNASLSNFKPGEMLVFNRTRSSIGGKLGDRTLRVDPGQTVKLEAPASKNGDYPVSIGFRAPGEPAVRPLTQTTWRFEAAMRQLLFILPDLERGVPRIWSVNVRPPEVAQRAP